MRPRLSLVYDSANIIPEGAPRTRDGMPLYPDPNLYPPEIIAGFQGWIELSIVEAVIAPVWIDPTNPKYKSYPTVRKNDKKMAVARVMGEHYQEEESLDPKYYIERFSEKVAVIYDSETLEVVCINARENFEGEYDVWEFAFVDPRVRTAPDLG